MDDFDMGLLDDTTYKVAVLRCVLKKNFCTKDNRRMSYPRQKMLGMFPVYMYRTKPKQDGEEYLADEWNLRKPLKQCSLRMERRGDILFIVFTYKEEGSPPSLFAVTKVDLMAENMSHYVKPVGDSSRFFALRVVDEQSGREAIVGLGFKEREEAEDFTQCLVNFQNAISKERMDRASSMANQ